MQTRDGMRYTYIYCMCNEKSVSVDLRLVIRG